MNIEQSQESIGKRLLKKTLHGVHGMEEMNRLKS